MAKVNLGKISVESYVMDKPVGISSSGAFIYPREVVDAKAAADLNLNRLTQQEKVRLVAERMRIEPEFEIGVLSDAGVYSKSEVLKQVNEQTAFGKKLVNIEMQYLPYFINQVLGIAEIIPFTRPTSPVRSETANGQDDVSPKRPTRIPTSVLFCENTTDGLTKLAATYRKNYVHPVFKAKGFNVISLEGSNDVRTQFAMQAKAKAVVYISGVGHGSYTEYTGDNYNSILQAGNYDSAETKGKIIHLLSCETARDLGPDTVVNGAKGYIGYTEDFMFHVATGDLFWAADSTFDICMANGCIIGEAIYDTYMQFISYAVALPGTVTASLLIGDRNILRSPSYGAAWGSSSSERIYSSMLSTVGNTSYAIAEVM